jgi:hypothetical protein
VAGYPGKPRKIAAHQNDAAYQIAEAYAYRGEVDKAFAWLDCAYCQRDPGTPEFKTDPLMKSLRQDPRYAELLKRCARRIEASERTLSFLFISIYR